MQYTLTIHVQNYQFEKLFFLLIHVSCLPLGLFVILWCVVGNSIQNKDLSPPEQRKWSNIIYFIGKIYCPKIELNKS